MLVAKSSSGHLFFRMIESMMAKVPPASPGKIDPELESVVLSVVMGSVGWVEASGNEMFSICAESSNHAALASLPPASVVDAGNYWKAKGGRLPSNCIEKWDLLMKQLAKPKLDRARPEVSEMKLLTTLRNRCTHAKPSHWPTQDADDKDLEAKLRSKFALNTFDGNTIFFPHEVLSAGCAKWAAETARQFLQHAFGVLHIPPQFGA